MKLAGFGLNRRTLVMLGASMLLAGCQVIPKGTTSSADGPAPTATPEPTATGLPTDDTRHRIALLVPMSGDNGLVGNSIANATTMAILDTNASNLRITTYDTAGGARAAARRAISEGNKLILGPLLANNVPAVLAEARPADVPLISYSNDTSVAGPDVFVMGNIPSQSIERTVEFARGRGSSNFAVIAPTGSYGDTARSAVNDAVRKFGGRVVATETYTRGNTSIVSAAQRLVQQGGFETVLIADGARLAALAAAELRPAGDGTTQLLGTELLSGEVGVTRTSAMQGMLFSAVSDGRFKRFSDSYKGRFGGQPYRISTLGYDSVLLTLRVARDWRIGSTFPINELRSEDGFLGLDGAFRFNRRGLIERAMEVREVQDGRVVIVSAAPSTFSD